MAPYTAKARTMKKTQLVDELNKLFTANEELRAQLAKTQSAVLREAKDIKSGVDDLTKSIEENFNIGQAVAALMSGEVLGERVKQLAIKSVIAFIYGYTLGVAGTSVVAAVALLTMPAWITFVINVAIVAGIVWFAMGTTGPVVNLVYNGAGSLRKFLSREFHGAKEWMQKATHEIREQHEKRTALREAALAASH